MKRFYFIGIIFFFLFACTSHSYEKAIADWIQTDNAGTWTDLKFKLIEVVETKDLTVSDSLQILKKQFEHERKKQVRMCLSDMKKKETYLGFAKYAGNTGEMQKTNATLGKLKVVLDSLQSMSFHSVYSGRDTTEVLAKYMKCKYSIVLPVLNTRQEKTETFLLTPAQDKCLGRMNKNI